MKLETSKTVAGIKYSTGDWLSSSNPLYPGKFIARISEYNPKEERFYYSQSGVYGHGMNKGSSDSITWFKQKYYKKLCKICIVFYNLNLE